jgi:hypothetical protein
VLWTEIADHGYECKTAPPDELPPPYKGSVSLTPHFIDKAKKTGRE